MNYIRKQIKQLGEKSEREKEKASMYNVLVDAEVDETAEIS